jgi:cell division protease FtsH
MVKEYGMSDRLGAVAFESDRRPLFLPAGNGVGSLGGKEYSEETAREIDQEIKRITNDTESRVHEILIRRREQLGSITLRLLEKEVLEGEELRALLGTTESVAPGASGTGN